MVNNMDKQADVIVIGGGVAGLSTAMQLSLRGQRVIVVERERLGNGSTGRAAGLLGQLRGTAEHTRMLIDGVEIVRDLEGQAGVEIFVQTGSLRVAETPERAQEIADLVSMGKSNGFDIDHMSVSSVARRMPHMRTDDLLDACYCPTDGHLQPAELVSAYVKVGKANGVQYVSNAPVEEIVTQDRKAAGVVAGGVEYVAPVIVNATGPWSYLLAEKSDVTLPTTALEHVYLTTRPDPAHPVDRLSPAMRNRHHRIYARPESGGLIVGTYEAEPEIAEMEQLPIDFDMSAMKTALDDIRVAMLIAAAGQRFPWIDERTPMTVTMGIMTFSPDGHPFCGKLPAYDGLYHCASFCGHGIVQSPTIGVIMADLILDGRTDYDIKQIEADRYYEQPGYIDRKEIAERCYRMYASYYGRVEGKG